VTTQVLTADELADRWRVSRHQVYRLARDRKIPATWLGRYVRFRLDLIEGWEADQDAEAA
jgi:excisionase family DNA binding protein